MGSSGGERFRDPLAQVYRFTDEVLVRCPACDGRAVVLGKLGDPEYAPPGPGPVQVRRRLRCGACGLFKDEYMSVSLIGAPVDPYFRLPLWLRAGVRGHVLWAYNEEHLDLLESYVAARLRERAAEPYAMSMIARLPGWLMAAKNRGEVLRVIARLRETLENS